MATFFTADTHVGDAHVLRQRRGRFGTLPEHDAALTARWNAVVTPDDAVWHPGDFAAGASRERCAEIFSRLDGTKRLIRGNHDTNRVLALPWAEPPQAPARPVPAMSASTRLGRPPGRSRGNRRAAGPRRMRAGGDRPRRRPVGAAGPCPPRPHLPGFTAGGWP